MRLTLLWSLTGAVLLVVAIGAGIWVGLQLPREAPPVPSPADTPASQPPRAEAPSVEPAPETARSDEDPPQRPRATASSVPEPAEETPTGTPAEPVHAPTDRPETVTAASTPERVEATPARAVTEPVQAPADTPETVAAASAPERVEAAPAKAATEPVQTPADTPDTVTAAAPERVEAVPARATEPVQVPADTSETVTAASAPERVEAVPAGTTAEPVQVPADPPDPAPESTSSVDPPGDDASKRTRVENMLRRLEATLASRPAGASPYPEFNAARERIGLGRTKALEAHGDGDIDSALRLLAEAEREAQELVRNEEARFRLSLQAAGEAYAAGNAETARTHVDQSLVQRPGDPEAKLWESRVARLPELLAERRKAQDARTAGKLREERAALRRIVELDPDDAGAAERVRAIDRQLREQAFARSIAQGRQAVEDRALEPAKQALAEAQLRKPQHADTQALGVQVAALERALLRDGHLAAAEQAAARDDWAAALRAFEEARAVEPTHDEAVSGSTLAARVVKAQRTVDGFLSLPERLGTVAVADAARDALREAQALTALSARLASSAQGLERAIEAARTPVPVRILSDERTEIGVRGVGRIGQVRDRTIELVPGEYVFEGKRKGYRSKLIEVLVEANPDAPVEVRVVCDERS